MDNYHLYISDAKTLLSDALNPKGFVMPSRAEIMNLREQIRNGILEEKVYTVYDVRPILNQMVHLQYLNGQYEFPQMTVKKVEKTPMQMMMAKQKFFN